MATKTTNKPTQASEYKPERVRASKEKVAKFVSSYAVNGNATEAYIKAAGGDVKISTAHTNGSRWLKKPEVQAALNYVQQRLAQGASEAVDKIIDHVHSDNESISLKASTYLVDQGIGKSIQRSETKTVNINIDSVLDMQLDKQ